MEIQSNQALATSNIIQERFPGRVVLSPEEVAEVWRGSRSRKAVVAIRKRLLRGMLVPSLKKSGGRWEIPVEALITAIQKSTSGDDEDLEGVAPAQPVATPPNSTSRRAIGPRISDIVDFWQEVFNAMDATVAEVRLARLTANGIWQWQQISVAQRKEMADVVVGGKPRSTYTDDQAAVMCGRDIRTLRRWRSGRDGPSYRTKTVKNNTVIVYPRSALINWLKSQPKHQQAIGVMVWNIDEAGRVSKTGLRDAGSLLDLLRAEHSNRESLSLAMVLYRQQVSDELDQAAWRLTEMPANESLRRPIIF